MKNMSLTLTEKDKIMNKWNSVENKTVILTNAVNLTVAFSRGVFLCVFMCVNTSL
jgi:hypothetical protein